MEEGDFYFHLDNGRCSRSLETQELAVLGKVSETLVNSYVGASAPIQTSSAHVPSVLCAVCSFGGTA